MIRRSDAASHWNLEELDRRYREWQEDPDSVSEDWQHFFAGFSLGCEREEEVAAEAPARPHGTPGRGRQERVDDMIYTFRDLGHTVCDLDPLGNNNTPENPHLELDHFGFEEADLELEFATANIPGMGHRSRLRDILDLLRDTYCRTIGIEYMHIQEPTQRRWIQEKIEPIRNRPGFARDDLRRILIKISQAELFENFLHTKFLGQKRFSLEGGESLIPAMDALVEDAADNGVEEMVLGMAHRGRLNVLANILNKSYEEIFAEFEGSIEGQADGDGDVKYHVGFSSDYVNRNERTIHLTLSANPSHLEAVCPVVEGRVRGKQRQHDDRKRKKVLPVLIHGDAAFAGQGLVMETLQFQGLDGYSTGGTIHIVFNNQIGFTTLPRDGRSTRYCTDIAKMFDCPVFHVNGDDPEAAVHAVALALDFRQRFGKDAFIDLVCYRRHGHNETDEPNYTQPTLYRSIADHEHLSEIYKRRLLEREDLEKAEIEGLARIMKNQLQTALETVKSNPPKSSASRFRGHWEGFDNKYRHDVVHTGVALPTLIKIGKALSSWPTGFNIHPKIKKLAAERGRIIREREPIEWALAELLAFGSLLVEGTPVRLSGQDSRRGTFSQRHSYWYDIETRERYSPLSNITKNQATFCVYNSPLSEAAVMAFDYGYSISEPNMLIIWEAQFGDFANGAQVIVDQFLTSSESKWGRVSGLVLMLPHGQEGLGPEHSSARLERFLQLCSEDNIQVAHCTTAAQHFHVLRRQMKRGFRKPLVLMTPKSHLRSKAASSPIEDLVKGHFEEVLDDPEADPAKVDRLVLCSGKVFHELRAARDELGLDRYAIVRIEQLYPFPTRRLKKVVARYGELDRVTWCQEEPRNMGAWTFVAPLLRQHLGRDHILFAGRENAASPAPGRLGQFKEEQAALIDQALDADDES